MTPKKFTITVGEVERSAVENGTTRKTWRAWINLEFRDGGFLKTVGGEGDGKAAHVAINRAVAAALAKVGR